MLIFLSLCVLALLMAPWNLHETLGMVSEPFYQFCLAVSPQGEWGPFYRALVCGASLPASEFLEALRQTSLLHLAIVSGSHLVLLEVILNKTLPGKIKTFLPVAGLIFIYTLMTGWQPPAVRALATSGVQFVNRRYKFFWNSHQSTWLAGLLTWAFFPLWAHSYSFLLSWGASLGLSAVANLGRLRFHQQWKGHFVIYLMLLPLLIPFGGMSPFSILCNWLLGPVLSLLFFPMSLLTFLCPPLQPAADLAWSAAAWTITTVGSWIPSSAAAPIRIPAIYLWFYIFALHIGFQIHDVLSKRERKKAK